MSIFSDRVYFIRKERKLSQEELGTIVGKNKAMISKYESGTHEPVISSLKELAEKLNISSDWLIGLSENRNGIKKYFKRDYEYLMNMCDELDDENYKTLYKFIMFLIAEQKYS